MSNSYLTEGISHAITPFILESKFQVHERRAIIKHFPFFAQVKKKMMKSSQIPLKGLWLKKIGNEYIL